METTNAMLATLRELLAVEREILAGQREVRALLRELVGRQREADAGAPASVDAGERQDQLDHQRRRLVQALRREGQQVSLDDVDEVVGQLRLLTIYHAMAEGALSAEAAAERVLRAQQRQGALAS